jgi:hypothetical protein
MNAAYLEISLHQKSPVFEQNRPLDFLTGKGNDISGHLVPI